jgi:hypothetical protein
LVNLRKSIEEVPVTSVRLVMCVIAEKILESIETPFSSVIDFSQNFAFLTYLWRT